MTGFELSEKLYDEFDIEDEKQIKFQPCFCAELVLIKRNYHI